MSFENCICCNFHFGRLKLDGKSGVFIQTIEHDTFGKHLREVKKAK